MNHFYKAHITIYISSLYMRSWKEKDRKEDSLINKIKSLNYST